MAYHSAVHETTGYTLAKVLFGRKMPCDLAFGRKPDEEIVGADYVNNLRQRMCDIHEEVRDHIQITSNRMK